MMKLQIIVEDMKIKIQNLSDQSNKKYIKIIREFLKYCTIEKHQKT